jgi:hypothetical protein
MSKIFISGFFLWLISSPVLNSVQAQIELKPKEELAGEFFGTPVPMSNYNFVKSVLMVFGNKWGPQPKDSQEWEDCIWQDLVLSYEAFRRNIQVSPQEIDTEVENTLSGEKVDFDWKKDKEAYARWLKEKLQGTPELFENQLKHLIQLQKLRKQVMDSFQPQATEEEAFQEFLNEYNTLSVELVQFDEEKKAQEFYDLAKTNPQSWEEEKGKRPKDFVRPGFVSLEFLMDLWGFPKGAAYKMMKMEIGEFYPPAPIYKGFGVFKILEKRIADEAKYPQRKESYYEQIRSKKRYEGFEQWVKDLKQRASIRVYKN